MNTASVWRALIGCQLALLVLSGSRLHAREPVPLRAGPLNMVFDVDNAFLRYVKIGEHEVLRGVNAPIRDQNWGTVRPKVSNVRFEYPKGGFQVTFDASCRERDIDFTWRGTITGKQVGEQSGEVEFTFDGVANSTFLRNRIGLCVLHGPSAAGKRWLIKRVSGEDLQGEFPTLISPHQPAKDIRGIAHELTRGLWAHVDFEGEVFEMEDQRNWTDASFKTYCTPLELPYPVKVEKGTKITHKVRIRVDGDFSQAKHPVNETVVLTLGKQESALPRIGLQMSTETTELTADQVKRLKELRLDHLYANLSASDRSLAEKLAQAKRQAEALGLNLHAAAQLGKAPETDLDNLTSAIKTAAPNVSAWSIGVTDWQHFSLARERLAGVRGKALLGASRGPNFVDLNRDRPTIEGLDFVSYPINPQIHAFDDASIVETLPIHAETVRCAKQFLGDRPLAIGPLTLRPPLSAPADAAGVVPADVDPRQTGPLAAAWTLGSIKYLADAGAPSATFFETVGWKGVMDVDKPAARPQWFPSAPGEVFPVYQLLHAVGEFAGGVSQQCDTSDSLSVIGLALKNKAGQSCLLVANMTGRKQWVEVRGLDSAVAITPLISDPATPGRATPTETGTIPASEAVPRLSFFLLPHAIIRIDRQSK
jgi:hypothetical protein